MNRIDLTTTGDEELAAKAQKRDPDSISALYERYYDRIYRFALARLGNTADAEDLAQEVFLKMMDKLNTFRWQGIPFAAWLFRIAHNAVVDFLRRKTRREQRGSINGMSPVTEVNPEAQAERSLSIGELIKAMGRLTLAQQEVLALRFGGGLSVRETAKALNKTEGTIKATQFQALQALRRTLSVEGEP